MRPRAVVDLEVYPNHFLMAFLDIETKKVRLFEHPLDIPAIWKILRHYTLVTFNGINYDMPLIRYALAGATESQLKTASDRIIQADLRPWVFEQEFGVSVNPETPHGTIDHIDLMGIPRGRAGLKTYAGRLHSPIIRELPFPPDTVLTEENKEVVRAYCTNDLSLTVDLYNALKVQLELRQSMSLQYDVDLRSKSDAQIAEAVMKSELQKLTHKIIKAPKEDGQMAFRYVAPAWMPKTETVKAFEAGLFSVSFMGKVLMPKEVNALKIKIAGVPYRVGIGGLHSEEKRCVYRSTVTKTYIDRDVTSYYPSILLNLNLFPKHVGQAFVDVYRTLVTRRLEAKKAGQLVIAETLKICINGLFGKTGNRFSPFYAPELMINITVTGQLSLLMLIEMLSGHEGIKVVSANTDGVTTEVEESMREVFAAIIEMWEDRTGFKTEETVYSSLHIRDVNNYIAVKANGHGVKVKGAYSEQFSLEKNPSNMICSRAVIDYLTLGASIEATICSSTDIREFLTIRKCAGGATYKGEYVGSVLRWYYSTNLEGHAFHYRNNGNLVARSTGGAPLPILPPAGVMPEDLDRDWYIQETYDMLADIGGA